MISKNNYFKILFLTITIFVFSAIAFYVKDDARENMTYNCSANYNITQSNLTIRSSIYLIIGQKNKASFDITGVLYHNGKEHKISRKYFFNYKRIGNKNFHLTNISLSKRTTDDVNDMQMEHLIFNYDSKSEKIMQITKLMNAYVIGNAYSPQFICISD